MSTSIVDTIDHLIRICRDGEEGYRFAGESVNSGDLKSLFHEYAKQRAEFVDALQKESIAFGKKVMTTEGSTAGAFHRGIMRIREAIASHDEYELLEECSRGEEQAVSAYHDAAKAQGLTDALRNIVAEQYAQIVCAHRRIKELQAALAPTRH